MEDTILLFKDNFRFKFNTICDMGCGTGYLTIILEKLFNAKLTAIDINEHAIALTKKNLTRNKV